MIDNIMQKIMKLSGQQQKWLKKNKHKKDIDSIARYLGLSLEDTKKLIGINEVEVAPNIQEKYFLLALFGLAFLVFATSLPNKFLSDDLSGILNNPTVGMWEGVTKQINGSLQALIYFLLVNIFGLVPWPLRLVNIAFHLTTAYLLYKTVRRTQKFSVSIISCAFFIVAPTITEPVIWISGMPYVLGGMATMLCVYLHLDDERTYKKDLAEVLSWLVVMSTIEKYIFIPFLLLVWDFYKGRFKKTFWMLATIFTLSLIKGLVFIRHFGLRVDTLNVDYYSDSASQVQNPIAKVLVSVGYHLYLYLWPKGLTLYHSEANLGWSSLVKYGSMTLLFVSGIVIAAKKNSQLWFWGLFSFASMVVVLMPFSVSSLVAERYGYLFYAGLAATLSIYISSWCTTRKRSEVIYSLLVIVFIAMITRSIIRIQDWKDADTLWFSAAPYSPSSFQNHNNLGDAYMNKGDYQMALEEFSRAIKLNPRYADAMHNRANIYWKLGDIEKAKQGYQEAYKNNPKLWQSLIKISEIEANQGNLSVAIETMKKAYSLNPAPEIAQWLKFLEEKRQLSK